MNMLKQQSLNFFFQKLNILFCFSALEATSNKYITLGIFSFDFTLIYVLVCSLHMAFTRLRRTNSQFLKIIWIIIKEVYLTISTLKFCSRGPASDNVKNLHEKMRLGHLRRRPIEISNESEVWSEVSVGVREPGLIALIIEDP